MMSLLLAFAVVGATAVVLVRQNSSNAALLRAKAPNKGSIIDGANGHVGDPVKDFCDTSYSNPQYPCADFVSDVLQDLGVPVPEGSVTEVNAAALLDWLVKQGWTRYPKTGSYDINNPPTDRGFAGCVVFFITPTGRVGHTGFIVSNPPMVVVDASGVQGKVVRREVNDPALDERYDRIVIVCPPSAK